ncbi:GxxExxY protein [Alphaproteobacteria bacterium]|jgi:GxxExxY protein|nr:GxxExxY protein [Alphaproteobacteria bacterium]
MNKNKIKILGDICLEIYDHLGGLNFDERDFQIALGYELTKKGIEYLRETHIELYYKDIPIKLGAPDFYLNKESPPTIIEIKLGASLTNSNRQQLKMYLLSIKRNPKSVIKNVKVGILINFLKEAPYTYKSEVIKNKKDFYKVEIEKFQLNNDNDLKLLQKLSLGLIK